MKLDPAYARAAVLLVAAASLAAGGCGQEDPVVVPPTGPISIDIRSGTWAILESATYSGDDSCLARDTLSIDTTDVLCNIGIGESGLFFPTNCEMTQDETTGEVTFDCTTRANLGICFQHIRVTGEGTVTDTTFDLTSVLTTWLVPQDGVDQSDCQRFYGNFVDACTTFIVTSGAWLDSSLVNADGDTVDCPEPESGALAVPLETFVRRAAFVDLWRR